MKQTLVKSCLLLFISIILINCEKDNSNDQNSSPVSQEQKKDFTVKKMNLNDIKKNSIIKNSLNKIEKQLDIYKPVLEKSKNNTNTIASAVPTGTPISSKNNTFTILTDEIIEVATDSTKAYTFRIETPTEPDSKFENFVIHKRSNDSLEYFIYRYKGTESDDEIYSLSREKVTADQINANDFKDYVQSTMYYDESTRCLFDIKYTDCCMVVEVLWCEGGGGGGGGTGTDNDSNGGSSDSSGNSTNTWPNNDSNDINSGGGGGGTAPSNDSNTDNTNSEGDVIGILQPTPLDLATNQFFDSLDQDKKDCLAAGFNQFKNEITNFFEDSQTVRPFGYDGPVIDTTITDFANAAIDGYCNGEIESLDEVIYVIEGAEDPIYNMDEYLNCFNTTQSASLTIYVNEPIDGTNSLIGRDRVGHTFVSIQQGSNIASYGFYPNSMLSSLVGGTQGVMEDNSNTEYDVSITINNISPSDLQKIITLSKSYAISDYHLSQRNCTDMGIALGNLAGLPIPECNANPIYFFGSTPGRLGEYMRNLTLPTGVTRNRIGGNSPDNNCN